MEREIKFRGLRTDGKGLAYGDLIHGVKHKNGKAYILPDNIQQEGCHHLDGFEVIPETVGQFTGLLDKNGKEIYEGDIVKYNKQNLEIRYFDNYGMFGLVGSNNYVSKVIDESKPMGSRGSSTSYKPYVLSDFYQKRIEIIGNIHENPELLK